MCTNNLPNINDIDLNPFDDPGGPVEIDLGIDDVDFLDIDITGTVEHEIYYIGKTFKSIDLNPFDANEALELDLIESGETIVKAIEKDPFGTIGTVALVLAGAPPWAFALNSGASAAYQGEDAEGIVGAMLKTYVGAQLGDVVANQTGNILQNAGVPESIVSLVEKGSEQFATTLIHTEGDLEAASNAFLTGSLTEGMGMVLGKIDDQLGNVLSTVDGETKQWTDLGAGIRDGITAGLTAAIEGGDIGEAALNNLVSTYTKGVIAPIVDVSEELGIDLDDPRVRMFAQGLSTSVNAAISGGMEPTDAFFASLNAQTAEKFKDYINSPEGLGINQKLDSFFGNQKAVEDDLEKLTQANTAKVAAANGYNAILNEEDRLYKRYTDAVDLYNSTEGAKGTNYAALGKAFQDYVANNKDQKAAYLAAYNAEQASIDDLQKTFNAASKTLLSDVNQIPELFEAFQTLNDEIVATSLAMSTALTKKTGPEFNKAAYAEAYGLSSEEEVYEHYFRNQGLAIESDLKRALGIMHNDLLQQTLSANGIDFRYLNDEQYKAALEYLAEEAPSFTSIDGPDDIIRLSDNILREIKTRSSAVDPELNQAYIDPNNYVFAEGVTISDVMAGKAVSEIVSINGTNKIRWELQEDREKWDTAVQTSINKAAAEQGVQPYAVLDAGRRPLDETAAEILRLTELGVDVTLINNAAANKQELLNSIKERVSEVEGTSDAGGYDRLLGNQEDNFGVTLTDMTVAEVLAFQKARGPGSYAEYSQGVNEDRGLLRDDGTGVISTPAGKYQIVGSTLQGLVDAGVVSLNDKFDEGTQERLGTYLIEQRGLYDGNLTTAQFIENLGKEFQGIALNGLGPELTVAALDRTKIINAEAGLSFVETETLPLKMEDVQRLVADLNVVVPVILNMDEQTGKDFDERTGSVVYQNLTKLANIFGLDATTAGEERFEKSTEVIGNAASVITGSYGEVSNLIGLALEYGGAEGASEFMKEASKDLLTFSNSAKSDEWQAQNIEDSERYDNLVAEWGEANPGKELTTAQKGLLKAEAIFTNIQDAPVQWIAENIGGEILQEGVNIAVGLAAKKGTSVALTGVKKSDLVDVGDRLTDIIENTAGVSGAVAVDIGEAYFGTVEGAYDKAYAEAIKMDFSEEAAEAYAAELAIKNATVAAVLATISAGTGGAALAKSIFNPNKSEITNRAIDGLVVTLKEGATEGLEEGITAAHLGSSLAQINPDYDAAVDVVEAGLLGTLIGGGTAGGIYTGDYMIDALIRTNKDVQNALNSEDPIVARDTLVNLGLTDVDSLNTMLNTSYDQFIVTTDELGQIIAEVNPDFVADADTIASYAGIRDEAETRVAIEQYVGDNYVTEEEVDAAAATAGVALTDEEKASYVGQSANEATLTTFAEDVEAARDEIKSFFAENNYNPTEAQVNNFLDSLTLTDARKEAISSYIDPRQVTEAEARQFFNDLGYTPTDEEIANVVGQGEEGFEGATKTNVGSYVDPRQTTEAEVRSAFEAAGFTPTDEQVAQFVGQLDQAAQETAIGQFVDPRQTTEDEVRSAFAALGFTPTDEQVAQFVGQLDQAAQETAIGQFVDPRQTTEAEVRSAFEAAGFTPTDEQVTQFVGQLDQAAQETAIGQFVDPRQTTEAEVRSAFEAAGFTPTDEQVAQFVGQLDQAAQETAVRQFVDPRQTTEDEVRAAFDALGFTPTDEQVAQFVGQLDQAAQETAVGQFVDPRQTTEAEVRSAFAALGFTPTDEQVAQFVGQLDQAAQETAVGQFVDPRQTTEAEVRSAFDALGFTPTDEQVTQFVGQLDQAAQETAVGQFVDPRQVTDEEARQFFADLGYTPTDEQVAEFVAQVSETEQAAAIASYVDLRQVTLAEVQAIADEEGLTLTDALAATYVGQGVAENYAAEKLSAARAEYDPLATTLAEATEFFANTGYSATPEEIAQFVASKTEETQTSAIGAYVDPRQVTAAEAEEFLSAIGYQPSQADIDQFTGQLNDENYQVAQKAAINEYVDPRFFSASEARAAYEELGLVDVTQEDVDRFVGQFDPESEDYDPAGFEAFQRERLRTYLPTATFNLISKTVGSPSVADDPNTPEDESKEATGIYKAIEEGSAKDVALQEAIDALSTNLGLTETEVLKQLGTTKEDLEKSIGDIETSLGEDISDLAGVIGTPAVEDDPDTLDVDETQDPTGIFADIADLVASGSTRDEAIQTIADNLGTTKSDLETAIANIDVTEQITSVIGTELGTPATDDAEATGIFADIADLVASGSTRDEAIQTIADNLGTTKSDLETAISTVETSLGEDITNLAGVIGTPATDDAEATGIFADIADLVASGSTRDEAIQTIANNLGTTKTDLETAIGAVETSLGEGITDIADILGTPEVLDDPNTLDVDESQDPTGLFATVKQYENSGVERDEALSLAIGDVSTALGTTETNLLNTIGTTKDDLLAIIGAPATDDTAATGIYASIDEGLGALSNDIASIIGKPAQNVTQVDIDFIADTIAQDQVLSELQIQQYDVTGDGIVNNADLNLLQQAFAGQDVQLADTSMFTPATGLYGTIDTQQQTIQDLQSQIDAQTALNTELNTNLNTQLNTLINTQQAQQEAAKRQQQQQGLMQLAAAARGVKVTPPDPFQLKYMYDIGGESIFATPTQESLFTSPYDTRRQATGFLSGGMVEDETDALLRILGG